MFKYLLMLGLLVGCGDTVMRPPKAKIIDISEFCEDKPNGLYGKNFDRPIAIKFIQKIYSDESKVEVGYESFTFSEDSLFIKCDINDSTKYWVIHTY